MREDIIICEEMIMNLETIIGMNDDVLIEILAFLPPESVFRFKSVSRRWRDLLSSRRFVQRHAAARRHVSGGLIGFFQKAAVHETSETLIAKHCNTLPLSICKDERDMKEENMIQVVATPKPKHVDVGHFINSSNGLILCSRSHGSVITYHVANPLTGKVVELPPPPHGKRCFVLNELHPFGKYGRLKSDCDLRGRQPPLCSAAFICDLDLNYSVVRAGMYCAGSEILYIDSYSSKTAKWSPMRQVVATGTFYLSDEPPVVANGVIHWYTTEGNIAVYDPIEDHLQFIGVPFAGKNDSYAVTRSPHDDHDVLWLGLVRKGGHNLLFYKLPKTKINGATYKRQVNIKPEEWELVHDVTIHALCQNSITNNKLIKRRRRRTGLVACKKTALECLMMIQDQPESELEVVALLRQDDKVFLYNVQRNSIQKVDYCGRYNQNHALSPYFKSPSLPSYCL